MATTTNSINNASNVFTSATNITSTSGNITATSGNIVLTSGELSINGSTGTNGQVIIAQTGGNPAWATLTQGSNITITNAANSITIASTASGGGITWAAVNVNASFTVNQGAINTKVALLTMTLPVTAAVGTQLGIQGTAAGSGGWSIAQNAGQNIQMGAYSTTVGTGGSLASSNANDSAILTCVVANTTWNYTSGIGNLTVT